MKNGHLIGWEFIQKPLKEALRSTECGTDTDEGEGSRNTRQPVSGQEGEMGPHAGGSSEIPQRAQNIAKAPLTQFIES